jgi:hypothetical protein
MNLKIVLFIVLCVFAFSTMSIASVQPLTFADLPLNFGNLLRSIFNTAVALADPISGGPGGCK